ncbi:MAG: SUF system NifU family Fe-S cluster assembly protein [Azospirillum sp.]|nr:SUF system NifU family Fe-S cluster assembly protein [Azospirillum sp.]
MFDDLRDLYQEVILDHGKHPRNFRHPPDANREAKGDNPMCGDRLVVYLKVSDQGIVEDAAFLGKGCAISTASASMMTEVIRGRSKEEVMALFRHFHELCTKDEEDRGEPEAIDPDALEKLMVLSGVRQFPVRVKCATLAWHTMAAAVDGDTVVSTE